MDENKGIERAYYKRVENGQHSEKTEFALSANESGCLVAVDCGCGTGNDMAFMESKLYQVYGFDKNDEAVSICQDRFRESTLVTISLSSFESYNYPKSGVVLANSSLYFAEPKVFTKTWNSIDSSLEIGGVFAGDFMGTDDSWASGFRCSITALEENDVSDLLSNFEILRFRERKEQGKTTLGKTKQWHTFTVVGVKRR